MYEYLQQKNEERNPRTDQTNWMISRGLRRLRTNSHKNGNRDEISNHESRGEEPEKQKNWYPTTKKTA